jgi:hypothetical protein
MNRLALLCTLGFTLAASEAGPKSLPLLRAKACNVQLERSTSFLFPPAPLAGELRLDEDNHVTFRVGEREHMLHYVLHYGQIYKLSGENQRPQGREQQAPVWSLIMEYEEDETQARHEVQFTLRCAQPTAFLASLQEHSGMRVSVSTQRQSRLRQQP